MKSTEDAGILMNGCNQWLDGLRSAWSCRLLLAGLLIGVCASDAGAEDEAARSPFVAGFERFGRHDELDSNVAGALLVRELSCTACHDSSVESFAAKRGPKLNAAARRLQQDWVVRYLDAPHRVKPGTTMPDVLAHLPASEKAEVLDALVAFLSTQQAAFPTLVANGGSPLRNEFWNKGDLAHGKKLYHEVGCVACHAPDADYEVGEVEESAIDRLMEELDPEELAELGLSGAARRVESIPLGELDQKYTRRSLAHFLHDPHRDRPASRMPKLNLTPTESADIAEYLLREQVAREQAFSIEPNADKALIETGRQFFVSMGCVNCHEASSVAVKPASSTKPMRAKPLKALDVTASASCFELSSGAKLSSEFSAHYPLDAMQVDAIKDALSDVLTEQDDAHLAVDQTLLSMNCYACHERAELGGVGRYRKAYFETVRQIDLGDEGRLPPSLSDVGKKLTTPWLKRVLAGEKATRLRSHMTIRMPVFSHPSVAELSDAITRADEPDTASEQEVFGKLNAKTLADRAAIGRQLMDVGCIQCHAFEHDALPGVVGVDLSGVPGRVYPSWFRDFVMDPGRLKQRTRMPTFFPDGKAQDPNLLDGDPVQQIGAMWSYLKHIKQQGVPEKIAEARSANYELKPSDHPIVLRTFMKQAGTHAIAVGFPSGTHFAFDAQRPNLVLGWKQQFVDARSTWFERFAPAIDPLGESTTELSRGFAIVSKEPGKQELADDETFQGDSRFSGYRLDSNRVPTFVYQFGDLKIEDTIRSDSETGLHRVLHFETSERDHADSSQPVANESTRRLYFRALVGKTIAKTSPTAWRRQDGLVLTLVGNGASEGEVITQAGTSQLLLPIHGKTQVEVNYQW